MFKRIVLANLLLLLSYAVFCQTVVDCPKNIGFENGKLDNWNAAIGTISQSTPVQGGGRTLSTLTFIDAVPPAIRIAVLPKSGNVDLYGKFPLNSPNGSKYILKLGNDISERGAERVKYSIAVPANVPSYTIGFSYAVVYESPLDHFDDEKPAFAATITDASGAVTACGSFRFLANGGNDGFIESTVRRAPDQAVFYKPWAPFMLNLTQYRGQTITIEFTVNDCSRGSHFGYAYVDVDESCSSPIVGNEICVNSESAVLSVITGFESYRWFNPVTQETLGTEANVVLSPAPLPGTRIGVEMIPYKGLGCPEVLYTTIKNSVPLQVTSPPMQCNSVDLTDPAITFGNASGLKYTYWKDAVATIPLLKPDDVRLGGTYYIKGELPSGCSDVVPVVVTLGAPPAPNIVDPPVVNYPAAIDLSTTFIADNTLNYTYWRDEKATIPLKNPKVVSRSGTFYVKATGSTGCSVIVPVNVKIILPEIVIPNTFSPNGDGINDVFSIILEGDVDVRFLKIYNRLGNIVYQTTDILKSWDGNSPKGKVPVGVYYWIIEGISEEKPFSMSGSITLLR